MKTKFEDNVASETPRPQGSKEPALPWKLNEEDLPESSGKSDSGSASALSAPPIRVRVLLIVLLIITIFAFISNTVTNIAIDKYEAEVSSARSSEEASTLKASLVKNVNAKNELSQSTAGLQQRVDELTAQKELYTAVLETIAEKGDEGFEPPVEGARE